MQLQLGGKFHLKLNTDERPIANKYREGKMKRTLKRELKVLEIAKREALETSDYWSSYLPFAVEGRFVVTLKARRISGQLVGGACEFQCVKIS